MNTLFVFATVSVIRYKGTELVKISFFTQRIFTHLSRFALH